MGKNFSNDKVHFRRKNYVKMRRFVPSFVTILALCVGFSAVKFAIDGVWDKCVYMLLLAAFFDGIDGKIARFMKCTSDFGAELDSLVDFVNFGASPAVVMYMFVLHSIPVIGWASALIFVVAMSIRLARFNSSIKSYGNFLVGVPAPFGPIIAYAPFMLFCGFGVAFHPILYCFFMIISAFLMVSKFPTVSAKKIHIPRRLFIPFSFGAVCVVSIVLYNHWIVLCMIPCLYIVSLPISYARGKKYMSNTSE